MIKNSQIGKGFTCKKIIEMKKRRIQLMNVVFYIVVFAITHLKKGIVKHVNPNYGKYEKHQVKNIVQLL